MGARGPTKRPEWMKVLSGTERADRPPDAPPVAQDQALTELPLTPEWLPNEVARNEWRKVGCELIKRGMLDEPRLMTLGIYCATAGKITQKYQAGDVPSAHLIAQFSKLGKELGIIGPSKQQEPAKSSASTSRLASIKDRSQRAD